MNEEQYKYQKAKARVDELKAFYSHLFMFVLVNGFFFVIDIFTSPGSWWFYWPLAGWGVGLFVHFMGVFVIGSVFGRNWEQKKIRDLMDKE